MAESPFIPLHDVVNILDAGIQDARMDVEIHNLHMEVQMPSDVNSSLGHLNQSAKNAARLATLLETKREMLDLVKPSLPDDGSVQLDLF